VDLCLPRHGAAEANLDGAIFQGELHIEGDELALGRFFQDPKAIYRQASPGKGRECRALARRHVFRAEVIAGQNGPAEKCNHDRGGRFAGDRPDVYVAELFWQGAGRHGLVASRKIEREGELGILEALGAGRVSRRGEIDALCLGGVDFRGTPLDVLKHRKGEGGEYQPEKEAYQRGPE